MAGLHTGVDITRHGNRPNFFLDCRWGGRGRLVETLEPFSLQFLSAFSSLARLPKCPVFPRLRGRRRRDENSSGKIWGGGGAADGPRWIRGCICNAACSSPARRGGGDVQSVPYIVEDNKQSQAQPSSYFDFMLSVGCY